jgi:hypothetical protein
MAHDDWAIVVGVRKYPSLTDLDGPENDANAMYQWLISPQGGDVPAEHVARILSSQFPAPLSPARAEPTTAQIQQAFEDLQDVAAKNGAAGNGRRVGRRLYIYLSGHGCAPRPNESALLTANASQLRVGYHILGKLYADWFLQSNFFDEAELFMDCCRESYPQAPPNVPPWIDITGAGALDTARAFYGFATKWSRLSRERLMEDGQVHGVFTWALLQGLKTAADANHQVTGSSLGGYLYNNMKTFLTPDDLADPDVPKEPELVYDQNHAIVFCALPPPDQPAQPNQPAPESPVTFTLPAQAAGKLVQVLNTTFKEVRRAQGTPPLWQTSLPPGPYIAQILELGRQTEVFVVDGTGAVNVAL